MNAPLPILSYTPAAARRLSASPPRRAVGRVGLLVAALALAASSATPEWAEAAAPTAPPPTSAAAAKPAPGKSASGKSASGKSASGKSATGTQQAEAGSATAQISVPFGRCCKAADPTTRLTAETGTAGVTVQPTGAPWPAGHADDVYYAGAKPSGRALPSGYHFQPLRGPLKVDLAARYPALKVVRFAAFHAGAGGRTLTPEAEQAMAELLHARLGKDLRLSRLGQGGHQVVWKACRRVAKGPSVCTVAKVRKVARSADAAARTAHATEAASALRRDLALFAVAEEVTRRGRLLTLPGGKGAPLPLRILGRIVAPRRQPVGPPGRIARVARILRPETLTDGVVVQELVAFRPSDRLRTMLRGLEGPDGALRDKAWTNAPTHGVNRVRVLGFLDRYKSVSRIGPDVIRLSAFVRDCAAVAKVPTIGAFCRQVRTDFRVPDDFLLRVRALEQLYRDSAGAVLRFHRANFDAGVGNPGVDGAVREVGLDFNHGRNVGWDPDTMQFVLFDA